MYNYVLFWICYFLSVLQWFCILKGFFCGTWSRACKTWSESRETNNFSVQKNSYGIEVKITFMLIAYLVLPCAFFWELLIFHVCRPQVNIYGHPLLRVLLGVAKSIVGLLLFLVWVLFSGFSILCIYVRWLHLSATPRNYSETQLIRSPMGQKRLAILTGLPY